MKSWSTQPVDTAARLIAGFRVPAVIIGLTNRLLPYLGVSVPPVGSVPSDGSVTVRAARELQGAVPAIQRVERLPVTPS